MNRQQRLPLILLALTVPMLAGCQSVRVHTDYDEAVDFTQYQTYDWLPARPDIPRNPQIDDPLDARIRQAIEENLEAEGFKKTTTERSDLYVVYYATVERKVGGSHINTMGYGRHGDPTPAHFESYQEGTLIIDLVDVLQRELVWRGTVRGAVTNIVHTRTAVFRAIDRILAEFPPEDG